VTRALARPDVWVFLLAAAGLHLAAGRGWVPFSQLEVVGVEAGAACVYLVVRRHIWNFPVGILSCAAFLVLFARERLYGDAGLQVVFILLGLHGWYHWLRGGPARTELTVSRVPRGEAAVLTATLAGGTLGLQWLLVQVKGSAPFLDALTTALSLVAQWMLNRKYVENWYVWIVADVFYVYLYITRELYLTAGLYAVFIGMCLAGVVAWRRALAAGGA
jgi:nicotinamide mononucleotide transporter